MTTFTDELLTSWLKLNEDVQSDIQADETGVRQSVYDLAQSVAGQVAKDVTDPHDVTQVLCVLTEVINEVHTEIHETVGLLQQLGLMDKNVFNTGDFIALLMLSAIAYVKRLQADEA